MKNLLFPRFRSGGQASERTAPPSECVPRLCSPAAGHSCDPSQSWTARSIPVFLSLLAAAWPGVAVAEPTPTIRFQQRPLPSELTTNGYSSQAGMSMKDGAETLFDFRVYENIRFERPERITEIRWQGIYGDRTTQPPTAGDPNTNEWELSIWSDSNGRPSQRLAVEQRAAADVPTTIRGTVLEWGLEVPRYEMAFRLETPFEAAPGTTYWISARSITTNFWPYFLVAPGQPPGTDPALRLAEDVQQRAVLDGCVQEDVYGIDLGEPGTMVDRQLENAITILTLPVHDADEDGMDDSWEQDHGLDPGADDSTLDPDGDGLSNLGEFERRTDPTNADMDMDGLPDGVETNTGFYVDANDRGTSPFAADSDGDGLIDGLENPATGFVLDEHAGSDPNLPDTDRDGLSDFDEVTVHRTDPTERDTDRDGISDHWELAQGADPRNDNSPALVQIAPMATSTQRYPGFMELPTFDNFNGDKDTADVTFRVVIDFEPKPSGPREVIFETGAGTRGFSLVLEAGNLLVLRAAGNSGNSLAVIEHELSESLLAGGDVEVVWAYDVLNDEGTQTIGLWINGVASDEVSKDLGGDWSGNNGAAFGVASTSFAGTGLNSGLRGEDLVSGTLNAADGLQVFTDTYPRTEVLLPESLPRIVSVDLDPAGGELQLQWRSTSGWSYNVRGTAEPSIGRPASWPIHGELRGLPSTPPLNTLTLPLPEYPGYLFVIEAVPAPPVTIFREGFEDGAGDWTTGLDGDPGTAWEVGTPGGLGPTAAHAGTQCVGTNIAGDYGSDANAWLRSPVIDLTQAGRATIRYFEYMDTDIGFDTGSLVVRDADTGGVLTILQENIDDLSGDWTEVVRSLPSTALGRRIQLEFRFTSDSEFNFAGWYLDDIEVTVP